MPREGPAIEVSTHRGRASVGLPEIPTSGYVWELSERPEGLRLVGDAYREEGAGAVAGGRGEHVFELEVPTPGEWEAVFELRRPWEAEPLERRRVVVHST